ncbi:tyrosine-type recombinase/integrase [Micromonospora sp. STR1_7]|uniref:Tyrosine-type recombinase/integrase n=1 Tax=Micromonospora parastrephiae TaxID=2806101 RepID=A0ABS1XRL5_9ACTN|nr:tyrosine-type recombinase/integrase [Micromonospora parastrephiae]
MGSGPPPGPPRQADLDGSYGRWRVGRWSARFARVGGRRNWFVPQPPTDRDPPTPHALRHFYASVLLDAGESVKALSEYLGHADPGFTLRTYTHLMPTSEDRKRRAVDKVLGSPSDGLATA